MLNINVEHNIKKRFFLVSYACIYNDGESFDDLLLTTNGSYVNKNIITREVKKAMFYNTPNRIAIMNIIELTEKDFKDFNN